METLRLYLFSLGSSHRHHLVVLVHRPRLWTTTAAGSCDLDHLGHPPASAGHRPQQSVQPVSQAPQHCLC